VVGVKINITDGSYHEVDSSEMAFQICAKDCFRDAFPRSKPVLLEPVMKVEIETPDNFQGAIVGDITSRRGMIVATTTRDDGVTQIECEVPLAETFGYASDLRSMSQGQATFTMELSGYRKVPAAIQDEIVAEKKQGDLVGAK
jgi:elongation factor G